MSPCFFCSPSLAKGWTRSGRGSFLHCVKGGTGEAGGVVSFAGEGVDAERTG